jgi:hypothetical protein
MGNHNLILNKFKSMLDEFDIKNPDHRIQVENFTLFRVFLAINLLNFFHKKLMKILMKVSDISNECRPVSVSEVWLDCLLLEFFNQVKNRT